MRLARTLRLTRLPWMDEAVWVGRDPLWGLRFLPQELVFSDPGGQAMGRPERILCALPTHPRPLDPSPASQVAGDRPYVPFCLLSPWSCRGLALPSVPALK